MKCDPSTLSSFLDGELPPGDRLAVAQHVASCHRCAALLVAYRRISSDLRLLPFADTPASINACVYAGLEKSSRGKFSILDAASWAPSLGAVALVALVAFAMSGMLRGLAETGSFSVLANSLRNQESVSFGQSASLVARAKSDTNSGILVSATRESRFSPPVVERTTLPSSNGGVAPERVATVHTSLPNPDDQPLKIPAPLETGGTGAPVPVRTSVPLSNIGSANVLLPTAQSAPTFASARVVSGVAPRDSSPQPGILTMTPTPAAAVVEGPVGKGVAVPTRAPPYPSDALARQVPTIDGGATKGQGGAATGPHLVVANTPIPNGLPIVAVPSIHETATPVTATVGLAACSIRPTAAFGILHDSSQDLRERLGCPISSARAITVTEHVADRWLVLLPGDGVVYFLAADSGTWLRSDEVLAQGSRTGKGLELASEVVDQARPLASNWPSSIDLWDVPGGTSKAAARTFEGMVEQFQKGFMLRSDQGVIFAVYSDGRWQAFPDPSASQKASPPTRSLVY